MANNQTFYLTTAIDYPNSRPHIGTAFEKLGADVQARYRRMQGFDVHFLMGNDENTIKVAKRAEELGQDVQTYCDDMAEQFKEVWATLQISHDDFIQTSEKRHCVGCQKFIQKVYDAGHIYKGSYEGLYCDGCEAYKTEKELIDGKCPIHKTPVIRRSEPCYYFRWSDFQDRLLKFYDENPDFIRPESRRNEVISFVKEGLKDLNLTRTGQSWGIQVPFDEEFTIYVWFDALLNYITAIGYGSDEERFNKWWPADVHFIGKDITRFHCVLWPAMLMAADLPIPKRVFGHGFVNIDREKISKSGRFLEPSEVLSRCSVDVYRYFFMRECPFPGDGEFTWERLAEVNNSELSNNLGNLYSRVVKLITANYENATLPNTSGRTPEPVSEGDRTALIRDIQKRIEACEYNVALQKLWSGVLDPANRYAEQNEPWKQVKSDKDAARTVLFNLVEPLRVAAIVLKPFIPNGAETIYRSFNFAKPWEEVSFEDALSATQATEDVRILAELDASGRVKPLYPRLDVPK